VDIRLPLQPSRSGRASSKAAALAVLATAQLVIGLDYSIVNVALPDIGRSLGFTGGTVQWVISAYTLTFGGFLLLGGRAADLLGRRRVFMAALSLFGLASLAGGLAQHAGLLIAARAAQGIGGAVLFPATLSLLNTTFEEGRERNRAIAVWGSAGAGGLSLGVLAGGVLTGLFGWPAVFFVNVPVTAALLLLLLAPLVLPEREPATSARRFDLPGALLVTLGAMAIVDSLVSAPTQGWTSVRTLVGGAVGLVLLAAFVVVELRSRSPLMPLRLLRIRTVRGGVLVTAAFMSSFGLQLFFLTLYLQQGLGQAPLKAGLSFLPLVLSVVAGTQVGGRLVGRVGISRTLAAGMTFGAVGLALYLRLPATPSLAILLPGMIVAGLGQGVAFTTMYVAAGTGVARGEQGVASAMASTAQQIGGSVGLAVLVALLSARRGARRQPGRSYRPASRHPDRGAARDLRGAGRHRPAGRGGRAVRHRPWGADPAPAPPAGAGVLP
jgi:EmrB/QacA subfamily drug resistance transporter